MQKLRQWMLRVVQLPVHWWRGEKRCPECGKWFVPRGVYRCEMGFHQSHEMCSRQCWDWHIPF